MIRQPESENVAFRLPFGLHDGLRFQAALFCLQGNHENE